MHQIGETAARVVVSDTQSSVGAIDQAVMSYSRLCASIVEVSNAADLPVTAGQPALAKVAAGLTALIEGREHIASATRELIKVQSASTLRETSFQCPGGLPKTSVEPQPIPAMIGS
jgi:hypothetical protein